MVMAIYRYVGIIGEFLLPPIFAYNIYDHQKILSWWTSQYTYTIIHKYCLGGQLVNYQQKWVRVNCHYFVVMENRSFPSIYSILNHLDINTQNITITLWMKEFKEIVHFIIIHWFDWSVIWVWNRVRGGFQCIIWSVSLYITIINGIVIHSPHDIRNNSTCLSRRGEGF